MLGRRARRCPERASGPGCPPRRRRSILRLRAQRTHQERPLVGDLRGHDRPRQAERDRGVGECSVLIGAEGHVLGRRRHDRGHELPVAGQVRDRDLLLGQDVQHLGRDLDVAEDDYLADRGHRDPVDLLAFDRDDQVLGAAADVGAGS